MLVDYLIIIHFTFTGIGVVLTLYHSKGHYTDYRFFILLVLCFVPILNIVATMNTIKDN